MKNVFIKQGFKQQGLKNKLVTVASERVNVIL